MLERLRLTTNPAPTNIQRHPRGRPQDGRVHKNKRARQGSQANVPKEQSDAETHSSDEERQSYVDSAVDFEPRIFHDAVFSPTQKSAIQETVSSSVNEAFCGYLKATRPNYVSRTTLAHPGLASLTQRLLWACIVLWKKALKTMYSSPVPSGGGLPRPGPEQEDSPPSPCLL